MKRFSLQDISWVSAQRLRDEARGVVLVPFASIEGHGHHCPLGTDSWMAQAVTELVLWGGFARGIDVFPLPFTAPAPGVVDAHWQQLTDTAARAWTAAAGAEARWTAEFFRACVQNVFATPREGHIKCSNCHRAGLIGFAPVPGEGRTAWNDKEAQDAFRVISRLIVPGNPVQSRFLLKPLHPDGGGSYAHNGPRRWQNRSARLGRRGEFRR